MTLKKKVVAVMFIAVLFPVVFSGSQSLASSPLAKQQYGAPPQTHNPQSYTAFGEHVRVEATLMGFQLHAWGFKNNAEFNILALNAEASWDPSIDITKMFAWKGSQENMLVE